MCTHNDNRAKIVELRAGAPAVVAYKALVLRGKRLTSSGHNYDWTEGWQIAKGDPELGLGDSSREHYKVHGMLPNGAVANGGGFHVSLTLKDAKAWCEPGSICNAIIKVMVDPKDIFALGTPNNSHGRQDMAVRRCYVESLKPCWKRPTREQLREKARKAKAKLQAKLKTKKKRKK